MSPQPAVETQALGKRYGSQWALRELDHEREASPTIFGQRRRHLVVREPPVRIDEEERKRDRPLVRQSEEAALVREIGPLELVAVPTLEVQLGLGMLARNVTHSRRPDLVEVVDEGPRSPQSQNRARAASTSVR
jgi:hypothetical protein